MERAEVENIVQARLATYHAENVERMTRIEDRIIGIDGNGTGRTGAIQRLDRKVDRVDGKVQQVSEDVDTLLHRSGWFPKKTVWKVLAALAMAAVGFMGSIAAEYVKHTAGWK